MKKKKCMFIVIKSINLQKELLWFGNESLLEFYSINIINSIINIINTSLHRNNIASKIFLLNKEF